MSPTSAALVLSWACIVLLALASAGLLRRVDALERAQSGGPGTPQPASGPRVGLQLPLERYLGGHVGGDRDVLLLVVSPLCGSCQTALSDLAAAQPAGLDVVVVTAQETFQPLAVPAAFGAIPDAGELLDVLDVPATPYLVRLDADGTIARADVVTSGTNLAVWTAPRARLAALTD